VHVPGTGDVLTPDACHRSTAVFNGYARYDLNLVFKRMETVTAEKGYRGPVMVCAWHVVPVAGYTPEDIKHSAAQRDNEIAFAPVTGTRFLVPFWIKWSTPLGPYEIEATSFITEPQPPQNPRTFRPAPTKPAKHPANGGSNTGSSTAAGMKSSSLPAKLPAAAGAFIRPRGMTASMCGGARAPRDGETTGGPLPRCQRGCS
jgi:hypothetical protein